MSIKKRLLLSNIAMIVLPVIGFLAIEIIVGYFVFVLGNAATEGKTLQFFLHIRMVAVLLLLILTNGLLTYYVSKTIIQPIKRLNQAAEKIKNGNLEESVESNKNDELGQLSNTFDEMRKSLKSSKEIQARYEDNRRELMANISHDLRTPVTSIKGYVQGVMDGVADSPEKLDRYMKIIHQKTDQLESMIDELFIYSKLDLDHMPFYFKNMDIVPYLKDVVEEFSFDYPQINITFAADVEQELLVKVDLEQLHRAIINILNNSVKYIDKEKEKIDITLTDHKEHVQIAIKDNGSGIKKEELFHIFDQFYRTDTSRNSSTGGSGLGLAIVKKIVEAHEGLVWADSELGKGTTVNLQLKKGEANGENSNY